MEHTAEVLDLRGRVIGTTPYIAKRRRAVVPQAIAPPAFIEQYEPIAAFMGSARHGLERWRSRYPNILSGWVGPLAFLTYLIGQAVNSHDEDAG